MDVALARVIEYIIRRGMVLSFKGCGPYKA